MQLVHKGVQRDVCKWEPALLSHEVAQTAILRDSSAIRAADNAGQTQTPMCKKGEKPRRARLFVGHDFGQTGGEGARGGKVFGGAAGQKVDLPDGYTPSPYFVNLWNQQVAVVWSRKILKTDGLNPKVWG